MFFVRHFATFHKPPPRGGPERGGRGSGLERRDVQDQTGAKRCERPDAQTFGGHAAVGLRRGLASSRPSPALLELGPDDGVVGDGLQRPHTHIHFDTNAAVGQGWSGEDVVDAPAIVPREGIAEIVPVGVLNDIRVQFAKGVDEAPAYGFGVGVAGVDVEVGVVDALIGMVDINGLGGGGNTRRFARRR